MSLLQLRSICHRSKEPQSAPICLMQAGSAVFCRYLEGLLAAEQQESGIPQERVRLLWLPGCSHYLAASTVPAIF